MTLQGSLARNRFTKAITALLFLSAIVFLQGCHSDRSTHFASHKVTLDRHGITNRFGVEGRDNLEIFHYDGYGTDGERLKVRIENDKVMLNEKMVGTLKKGDAVHLGDEGMTVNNLDYGQTEKYLEASLKQETSQNLAK